MSHGVADQTRGVTDTELSHELGAVLSALVAPVRYGKPVGRRSLVRSTCFLLQKDKRYSAIGVKINLAQPRCRSPPFLLDVGSRLEASASIYSRGEPRGVCDREAEACKPGNLRRAARAMRARRWPDYAILAKLWLVVRCRGNQCFAR